MVVFLCSAVPVHWAFIWHRKSLNAPQYRVVIVGLFFSSFALRVPSAVSKQEWVPSSGMWCCFCIAPFLSIGRFFCIYRVETPRIYRAVLCLSGSIRAHIVHRHGRLREIASILFLPGALEGTPWFGATSIRPFIRLGIPTTWWYDGMIPLLGAKHVVCLLYTSPSPRDATLSRMPSSA